MKTLVVAAIAGLFLAGCYRPTCACAVAPSNSPSPLSYDVTATNTDHAVTMHVGQKLQVVLRAASGMNRWTQPATSDSSILAAVLDPAATAAVDVTLAAFQAMKLGQADVTSNASVKCAPNQACPMLVAVYSLKVTVTP